MDKAKRLGPITDNLNKALQKLLDNFSYNIQWTDINNWLRSLQAILRDNPSPYINQKVLLSKRLNQCINPILPQKIHEEVLVIHQILFYNIKSNSDNNINQYIKLLSDDLGIYSLSIFPYFTHTTSSYHRLMILKMLNEYYLDLGLQLIPMLMGIVKSILPVYNQTKDKGVLHQIQSFMNKLLDRAGRRYVISAIWSCILKFSDCRSAGVKFLGKFIGRMEFMKDEQEFQSEHGFSQEQRQVQKQKQEQQKRQEELGIKAVEGEHQTISQNFQDPKDSIEGESHEQLNSLKNKQVLTKIKEVSESEEITDPHVSLPQQDDINDKESIKSQRILRLMATSQGPVSLLNQKAQQQSLVIKLDKVPLMLTSGIELIKQGINNDCNQNNFPHHNILVLNSIIACLEDNSQFIKRAALDFMFTHLRLKSNILDQNDRKLLVEAGIRLFKKKEVSVIKRVNRWLLGKENLDNVFEINEKNQFVLGYIINAFQKILATEPTSIEDAAIPLKIVQNFFMEHSHLLEKIISFVSVDLLRYVFNYSTGFDYSEQVAKAGSRFFSNIPSHYNLLFESIGKLLISGIKTNNDHLAYQCIKYLDYCYLKLMKHEHGLEQLQYITITLQLLTEGLHEFATSHTEASDFYRVYLKDINLLVYNLISRRESVQKYMNKEREQLDKKYFKQSGLNELPPERVEYQESIKKEQEKQRESYIEIQNRMETFFVVLGQIIKRTPNIEIFQDIYRLGSMSIVKLKNLLPLNTKITQLPKWFNTIEYGIRVQSPIVSLAAIEAMIKCLMFQEKHPIYAQFKKLVLENKSIKNGNDYQNLALQKLWSLLDYPHMHNKIIDLIVAFSKYFPNQFTETVKRSFQTHSDPQKQASIQRFSHFWRLTGFKYKDLLLNNKEFAELNKVGLFKMLDFLDDQNPLVRHAAKNWMIESLPLFHRVLEPLFYELMKVGCDWYNTPKGLLIIRNSYDTSIVFNTFRRVRSLLANGTFAFLRYVYQKQISDRLDEMREKITTIKESILTDFDNKQVALPMVDPSMQKQPVLPRSLEQKPEIEKQKHMTYIDMLIILCVRYLEGIAIESMGIDFYTGNAGVNTSAIQLLETMINYIDNPKLCFKLIDYIMQPLCKVLNQAVMNKQYITQIQLINLLKTIFFNSSFRKKGDTQKIRTFFKGVFTKSFFLSSMLNGLQTPFAYVRAQFISFITSCIELIANFLEPAQCTQCIKRILFSYYKIIKQIRVGLIQQVLYEEDKSLETLNMMEQNKKDNTLGLSRIVQMQLKSQQEQKLMKLTNNLQQVAKTNEILSILHGVASILNYFYDLDKMDISQMRFQIANPYTIFDSFKSIVTLGFSSSEKLGRLIEKTQFLHNMQTAQQILQDLSPVYETILRAWPLSEQFVRIATQEFTSIGSRNFNFEKFSRYNRVLFDLISFVDKQSETIWGKIFSILKPMFYRFPRQIMEIYLKLWVRQCTNVGAGLGQPDLKQKLNMRPNVQNTQFLMKNLQTIIVSNFPINIIVHAFLETSLIEQIRNYYVNRKKQKKQSTLSFHISQLQAKLLYFLYVYFMYSHVDEKTLTKQTLLSIWSIILKAVRPFINSNTPNTSIWIIDIINMCAIKYSPKQILTNQKFKTDLHGVVNQLLKQIASVASKKNPLFYEDPTKLDLKQVEQKYRVVLPLPPCLFQIYKTKRKDRNQLDKQLFYPIRAGENVQLQRINRLWCFKALKRNGYQVIQNTYLPEKAHFGVIRACQWMEIILPVIEDKSNENMIYAESASQVLYNLLEQARIVFIKPLKTSIIRIFDKDDFFICNKNTLDYWAKIIDWVVSMDKKNETFEEYLEKVSLSSSYFTSESTQNKKRIKSFQRICFILYSGQLDKYAFKIKGLLQKIADVIKMAQSAHPALLILILFSIRILILRLSEISLNQLFIDIWPMILAFLMQIFNKTFVKVEIGNEISRNPNLLLAALKLLQMISISNLSEFAHHQWVFIYDYFGLKIYLPQTSVQLSSILSQRSELSHLPSFSRNKTQSPFYYKPYMINELPDHSIQYRCSENKAKEVEMQYQPMKRLIILKNSFIKTEDEVKAYAYLLAQYLIKLNQFRIQADMKEVQEVIINDFIKLDSFIHTI